MAIETKKELKEKTTCDKIKKSYFGGCNFGVFIIGMLASMGGMGYGIHCK